MGTPAQEVTKLYSVIFNHQRDVSHEIKNLIDDFESPHPVQENESATIATAYDNAVTSAGHMKFFDDESLQQSRRAVAELKRLIDTANMAGQDTIAAEVTFKEARLKQKREMLKDRDARWAALPTRQLQGKQAIDQEHEAELTRLKAVYEKREAAATARS